jgi:hypothetical protein
VQVPQPPLHEARHIKTPSPESRTAAELDGSLSIFTLCVPVRDGDTDEGDP